MNHIFVELLSDKVQRFKSSFSDTAPKLFQDPNGKLFHPGEFGSFREDVCEDFLSTIIPKKFRIGKGFLINTFGEVGTQCDIIIYDYNSSPNLEMADKRKFFPVESVVAIGEVKSTLSKSQFCDSLTKMAKNKDMKERIKTPTILFRDRMVPGTPFSPRLNPYDQIFSFMICKKFDFDLSSIHEIINSCYVNNSIEYRNRHNLILSVDDGLLAYINDGKTLMYPLMRGIELKNRFVYSDTSDCHFRFFSSYLFMAASSGTILFPDLVDYIGQFTGGFNFDQK